MNPLIIVPTYISAREKARPTGHHTVYDHVTPLSRPGELGRMLKSLQRVRGVGQIVIPVAAERDAAVPAMQKVQAICAQFPSLNIIAVGQAELALIRQRFEQLNMGRMEYEIGLEGYSAVRNLGLVLANIFGYDSAVFLDDDVVIQDPEFLAKGVYGLGKLTRRGIPILAKTGYYLNSEGTYHSKSQDKWYNRYWEQGSAFNSWIDSAMRGPRLSRSNHVCGGCLVLHREAYRRVCFDPWVVRGEDLDYMLNLRMYGSDIWFDNKWVMLHLPPDTKSEGTRFRQDIFRWLYEYRKMEYARTQIDLNQVKPESLMPYPGPFLEPGIRHRIMRTALLRSFGRPDKKQYRNAAKVAFTDATEYAESNCSKYFEFQYIWPELMARTENDRILRTALLESAALRHGEMRQQESLDPGATSEIRLNLPDSE
ncbi:hypothetical protein [Denitrobacterium detoxificans]|jgi:glycosyltransferase involved in cell wall biosynthesis|uniref:hypothetical protein n=1 Tax=Denitrobacterium detoxificans TaxID=79604 RepID=UPI0026EEB36D|nr:hypothetical protein [Denitrobacterium detoxificans]MBE6466853.1 hypothetical protein [Denitrobacterium detoxificans]